MRPKAKLDAPPAPILGDASLIRFATDATMSVVSFTAQMLSVEDTSEFGVQPTEDHTPWREDLLAARFGRYVVIGRIGAGGMGRVYLARDEQVGREVAIKVLGGVPSGTHPTARFLREATIMGKLNHPNFAALYDLGEEDGVPYIVAEYVRGRSLADRLTDGPVPPKEAARVSWSSWREPCTMPMRLGSSTAI